MSCPDLLVLSQLADGELPAHETTALRAHVDSCRACGARVVRIGEAMAGVSRAAALASLAAAGAAGDRTAANGCLTPSSVAAWLDPDADAADRSGIARHVEECDSCLAAALAARRVVRSLEAPPRLRTPAEVKERVAAGWSARAASAAAPALAATAAASTAAAPSRASARALSELVIRVTRSGASLLERHLVAPLRELVEMPAPMPAMRAGETNRAALRFELRAAAARVSATVVPAGDLVGLTLALESDAGELLPDQRVFLRRHGRSIFSARTAADGTLHLPGLQRGVYEVSCPGIGTEFRIDLRS